ncbi:G0/G1 switch protein 2 [Syngnathus scovelli]|uniref:G0/G1 switch protein 2 n=1 Tax=Syngnathus scovelli TaxID=161590 RepID=UPI0035CB739E
MESTQELVVFAKEMLRQKPSRHLLKVYLIGSVFALVGTVMGLLEMASRPFSSEEPADTEMLLGMPEEPRTVASVTPRKVQVWPKKEEREQDTIQSMTFTKLQGERGLSNRLHASRS